MTAAIVFSSTTGLIAGTVLGGLLWQSPGTGLAAGIALGWCATALLILAALLAPAPAPAADPARSPLPGPDPRL